MSSGGIVTGTDGSDSAAEALRQAAALASSSGSALHVVGATFDSHYLERVERLALMSTGGLGRDVSPLLRAQLVSSIPVLVVWGTHDRVIPATHADLVRAALPHAEVVLMDGIGHTPHLSQPAFVGERLSAWTRTSRAADGVEWEVERPASHA